MRMSEAYAAAVAGLVPVVLLLITVEITSNRSRMHDLFAEVGRPAAVARSMARREHFTQQQIERAERATHALRSGIRQLRWMLVYLAGSAAVALMLLDAERRALRWLGDPSPGPAESDAKYCLIVLGIAFFRVVIAPLLDILRPLVEGAADLLPAAGSITRLSRVVERTRREQLTGCPTPPQAAGVRTPGDAQS
ncbi:hypothetical protein [Streptomyces sp. NPDC060027]|uniref:hypothetical protein n=1 Tax=Streptomyces sp. NPDC060027 TaxID=3347040 RepID=UPI00369B6007